MTLRIIAGKFKGRTLLAPKTIRPASAMLRGAIFNICQATIEGSNFLDVFAGSGAMGLEALSRGAQFACFIDNGKESIKAIYKNIENFNVKESTLVIYKDALQAMKKISKKFDFISIDPPFILYKDNPEFINQILMAIVENGVLEKTGTIFLEEASYSKRQKELNILKLKNEKRFGGNLLLQYVRP